MARDMACTDPQVAMSIVTSLRIFLEMPRSINDATAMDHVEKIAYAEDVSTKALIEAASIGSD